jgi:transposase-like protein
MKTKRSPRSFDDNERRKIIAESFTGKKTRTEIWRHYTGQDEEHGQILRWMRQLGLISDPFSKKPLVLLTMRKKKTKGTDEALKKRIKQLERQLEDSQLTAEAYRRMIQLAEEQLKIDIQKKSTTK